MSRVPGLARPFSGLLTLTVVGGLAVTGLAASTSTAAADDVAPTTGTVSVKAVGDTYLQKKHPRRTAGSSPFVRITPGRSVGLVSFPAAAVPAGATVTEAALCVTPAASARTRLAAYRSTLRWTERSTWRHRPALSSRRAGTSPTTLVRRSRVCVPVAPSLAESAVAFRLKTSRRAVLLSSETGAAPTLEVTWSVPVPPAPTAAPVETTTGSEPTAPAPTEPTATEPTTTTPVPTTTEPTPTAPAPTTTAPAPPAPTTTAPAPPAPTTTAPAPTSAPVTTALGKVLWDGSFDKGGVPHGANGKSCGTGSDDGPDSVADQYSSVEEMGNTLCLNKIAMSSARTRTPDSTRSLKVWLAGGQQREQAQSKYGWTPDAKGTVDQWYGFSIYYENDWASVGSVLKDISGSAWHNPMAFRMVGDNGSMNFSGDMNMNNENGKAYKTFSEPHMILRRNTVKNQQGFYKDGAGLDKMDLGPIVQNKWMDFVCHVRWSTTSTNALRECWRDGAYMGAKTTLNAVAANKHFLRIGQYQTTSLGYGRTSYFDNVRIGTSYAAVDPSRTR